jgi:tRNA(Phe) wybutosine-synthesizing methylase Tyw3
MGRKEECMVRIITPRGYDYVLERMLQHYIDTGYCLSIAETCDETLRRLKVKKESWMKRFKTPGGSHVER